MTIPSHKTVKFRPYLVKEEKILLLAFESKDEKQSMEAMVKLLMRVFKIQSIPANTTFDVEYMFTQIRSKSVGEKK